MANYYDWKPTDDKSKRERPSVEPDPALASSILPSEDVAAASAESVESAYVAPTFDQLSSDEPRPTESTAQWPSDATTALPSFLTDEEAVTAPIESDDELHPMYRVVSAMMDTDDTVIGEPDSASPASSQPESSVIVPIPDEVVEIVPSELVVLPDTPPVVLPDETTELLIDIPYLTPIQTRIAELSNAIELHPKSPVNYVLRGEANLEEGRISEAVRDFLAAIELSEHRDTTWEYLNRSFLDRARQGLRRCGYDDKGGF